MSIKPATIAKSQPGRFGPYGGRYVPETLMAALEELERAYGKAKRDRKFQRELDDLRRNYAGRPTPLFFASQLTRKLGGAKIYLKREDLLHTGAHKINNCLGQALLAVRMDKRRIIACVGGGSNAMGIFHAFLGDKKVKLIGVEAGGRGKKLGEHAARLDGGSPGVLQGTFSYVLQNSHGQIAATHSVSAGLDYPGIGPEHAWLHESGRAEYVSASDAEALAACQLLSRSEGIIPALESAHAVAECVKRAGKMRKNEIVIVNVSGRGDKDMGILREELTGLNQ